MRFAPGARRYATAAGVLAALSLLVSAWLAAGFAALAGGVLWFLRDPDRTPPTDGILAPADGRVSVLRTAGDRVRVGVFMSPIDVHVNRAPLGGTVRGVEHRPGAHRPAFSKDSDRNEQVRIAIDEAEVVLIAGAFARRITPYVEEGDAVTPGERIGHISFGSRADVVFPAAVGEDDVVVDVGDRVRAGETVIASMS